MKILVIDQDTHILEMLQTSLSRARHFVYIAVDGSAGLRLARTQKPDLIILDVLLPNINGMEVCQQLRQDPNTKNIPVMLISALALPTIEAASEATPYGNTPFSELYQAYLPKPLNLNQFLRTVDNILSPNKQSYTATGPSVLLITQNDTQRTVIKKSLEEQNYHIYAYTTIIKPLEAMRVPPSVLIIDDSFLTASLWKSIKQLQHTNPIFTLIVLQAESSPFSPDQFEGHVDDLIPLPIYPWRVVQSVNNSLTYCHNQERIKVLSQDLLYLNQKVTESTTALKSQNEELDFVNRQLHKLSELKETLTAMLVHDLKAPLSAMMGALQFLTMDPGNTIAESSEKFIKGGLAAGKQMIRFTHTLLDEQKLENNKLVFDLEPIDFETTLSHSLEMMDPLFSLHKVKVEVKVDSDMPLIMADTIIFQRIIENLLDNAIKYSPTNETIFIIATRNDKMLKVCIADRGDGIPPEYQNVIFNPFTQLAEEGIEKIRGSVGLGLAFCKLAVETMGGKIWVENLDQGTGFYFTIPVYDV